MTDLPETLAPIRDLGEGDAFECWRWLVGPDAKPRLLTAMGDIIAIAPAGAPPIDAVFLLDTYAGTFEQIAFSWSHFKTLLGSSEDVHDWFKSDLVADLREKGLVLAEGQCYSPYLPPMVGGSYKLSNFEMCPWRVHVGVTGQIAEKSRDLPEGTIIQGFVLKLGA